jgi:ubiquinone/menaquinone biosynthesis C-methylase UbiE
MRYAAASSQARQAANGTTSGDSDAARSFTLEFRAPDPLTERSRRVWSAGDDDRIAVGFRDEAEAFVRRRRLGPGQRVLDAACGSGNLTIPAARAGASVTGLDLVPSLLARARERADDEGLRLTLDEGNVEELPYPDGEFDVVLSMFGVMFAARPERVVAELARVTRRGGQVALASWTRAGFTGQMLAMHAALVRPPQEVPSPLLWADEQVVRELFDSGTWRVMTILRALTFRYPHTPPGTAELFRTAYGPTVHTFEALDPDGRASLAADLAEHWWRHQRVSGSTTEVDAEYLEVVAVRR